MGANATKTIYDIAVKDAKGGKVELGQYRGKVLLIVNVASACGLTDANYSEMNQLYEKYKNEGLEILAFPCNQFKEQEPGTDSEIQQFVCERFRAEFTVFAKVDVNGEHACPLYKFLRSSKSGMPKEPINWNFTKFLVDRDGRVVERIPATNLPLSCENNIKKLLGISEVMELRAAGAPV